MQIGELIGRPSDPVKLALLQREIPGEKFGDRIRIEMFDRAGQSIFGAIDQKVVKYDPPG